MKLKREHKLSVYVRLFLSYVLVLSIPLVCGMVIYSITLKRSQEQTDKLNRSLMQNVRDRCDDEIGKVMQNLNRLAFNINVQNLSLQRNSFDAQDQYSMWLLYQDLRDQNFVAGDYQEMYVYFKNTDMIASVGGNMSLEMFHKIYYEDTDITLDELRQYLTDFHFQEIMPVETEEGDKSILCTLTSLRSDIGENSATICIRMDSDLLDSQFESSKWNEGIHFEILNRKNQVMNTVDESMLTDQFSYEELDQGKQLHIVRNGVHYVGEVLNSDVTHWKYICMMPMDVIKEQAASIQQISTIGLFLCLIASLSVSGLLTKHNYNPIRELIELFRSARREETKEEAISGNEYAWLTQQTRFFVDKYKEFEKKERKMKQFYLFRLLQSNRQMLDQSLVERYTEALRQPFNAAVLLRGGRQIDRLKQKDGEDIGQEEQIQEERLLNFIISNIGEEVLSEQFSTEVIDMGDAVVIIVNMPAEDESYVTVLRECLEKIQGTIRTLFQVDVTALAGGIHKGLDGIHLSYQEIQEAEGYLSLLDEPIIFYRDVQNTSCHYDYPMEAEQRIVNAIRRGSAETAEQEIDQILRQNYGTAHISASAYMCLLYDMMGTIVKGADEVGLSRFFETHEFNIHVSMRQSFEEVQEEFHRMIETLCGESQKQHKEEGVQLSEKIKKYVEENYRDPDLNISQTAFYFEMTPTYISGIFKKQTGGSLLKYINTVRVEASKELLKQGVSVAETSERVGYRESRTFIRVFKEIEGMTPGQLKKQKD